MKTSTRILLKYKGYRTVIFYFILFIVKLILLIFLCIKNIFFCNVKHNLGCVKQQFSDYIFDVNYSGTATSLCPGII